MRAPLSIYTLKFQDRLLLVGEEENKIAECRQEIDQIDQELLRLINNRVAVGLEIGKVKKANGWPVYVPEREAEVLEKLRKNNPGPLGGDAVTRIFQEIIQHTKNIETDISD